MMKVPVLFPESDELKRRIMSTARESEVVHEETVAELINPYANERACIVQVLMVAVQCITAGEPEFAALLFARVPRYIRALVDDAETRQRALDLFARRMATHYADDRLIA